MSLMTIRWTAAVGLLLASVACSQRVEGTSVAASPVAPTAMSSSGGTLTETLTGAAINGVTPEGQAQADESQFASGGSTRLTVQIKNVNLADGTRLGVTLDFTPIGTITLSRGAGTLSADLGHFGVSYDQVRVNQGNTTILSGSFFK